jgi:hypothetical protein
VRHLVGITLDRCQQIAPDSQVSSVDWFILSFAVGRSTVTDSDKNW